MNQLCDHFLAGTAISQNQHVDVDICNQFDLAMDFQHLRRRSQKEIAAIQIFQIRNSGHIFRNVRRMRKIGRRNRKFTEVGRYVADPRAHSCWRESRTRRRPTQCLRA